MVFGKEVTLQTHGLDKYKRTLADVLPAGTSITRWSKQAGGGSGIGSMRRGYRSWKWLEKESRESKKGLWVGPTHVPPWGWRKGAGERRVASFTAGVLIGIRHLRRE